MSGTRTEQESKHTPLCEKALHFARAKFKRLAWSPDHRNWAPINILDAERIMAESIDAALADSRPDRNRRLLEAGQRLADEVRIELGIYGGSAKLRRELAAYEEAAK